MSILGHDRWPKIRFHIGISTAIANPEAFLIRAGTRSNSDSVSKLKEVGVSFDRLNFDLRCRSRKQAYSPVLADKARAYVLAF